MKHLKLIVNFTIIFILLLLPANLVLATNININNTEIDSTTESKNTEINSSIDTENYNPDNLTTNSASVLLMDAKTGNILYSKNAFEKKFPASTTKLMTAILTLENCKLTDVVTVSHNAVFSVPIGYSHASLVEGEKLTVEELLNVLLIPSANDAAFALAEHIAGSVDNFSTMMNNKAKEIGCLNTHFVNPNGIHDDNHYSTAYDLALIGRYAMQFDDIMRIAKVNQYTLPKTNKYDKENRIFNATNGLITKNDEYYYPDATGLKTGYTDKSGYCIVSTARKGNVDLLEVVLGSNSIEDRYEDCIQLFDYGFENYSNNNLVSANEVVENIEIAGATKETKSLDVLAQNSIEVLLKNNIDVNSLDKKIELNENLSAPIAKGAIVGKVTYTIDGKNYSTDLVASSTVIPSNFETIIFRILLVFLILCLLVLILKKLDHYGKGQKSMRSSKNKKHNSKNTKHSKGNGRFKFTQINEYL